ncbi:MAG TPA: hemerythrin domain-containing protein [Methanoregulaceae archaeon]|nr:hemerythrin domain-containing protein [Methanoregulaceae archaeon]
MTTQQTTQETIVEHIRRDHRKTDREILELEMRLRGRGDEDLGPVFAPMKQELLGHMAAEEKLLYPPLEKEMREQIADARKEHDTIRRQLEELAAGGRMEESEWRRRLVMLKQEIQHHVTDEESEILPAARRLFDEDRLRDLGSRFERMEKEYT